MGPLGVCGAGPAGSAGRRRRPGPARENGAGGPWSTAPVRARPGAAPPAALVSPSPCWGAGPGPASAGAGESWGSSRVGEGAGHGVWGAEGVLSQSGSAQGGAPGPKNWREPDVWSWPGSRRRSVGSKRNRGQDRWG